MNQDDAPLSHLPLSEVLLRQVFEGHDGEPTVYCGRAGEDKPIVNCNGCPRNMGLRIEARGQRVFLECAATAAEVAVARAQSITRTPHTHGGSTPVIVLSDIMASPVITVPAHTPLPEVVRALLDHRIGTVVVANDEGAHLGIVSRGDLLRTCPGGDDAVGSPPSRRAADVMTPLLLSLPADSEVTRAAALMAYEGIHHVLVTDGDGDTVGMVSSLDVMAWIAKNAGFVVPTPAH